MSARKARGLTAVCASITLALSAILASGGDLLVSNQQEYAAAVDRAAPDDTIVLADGEWRDFEIVFTGQGLPDAPITLTAQTKGKVFITGRSNLRIAGEHLVVSGLVFRDGHTPTNEVIAFRRTKEHLANHSRVTEVVIDRFNNPERHERDFWVMMYGKHNRFDHSMLVGKSNSGVTMAVRLDSEASQENEHRIDHNYFGPRPILGSNGGETLRIGTSKYSLTESRTVVERNYFERCNGELEIISNKAGGNVFRGNAFVESRGTLTMRHGNDTLVEDNVFFGNGVPHTGGIRVINKNQTVRNNYLSGLTGRRFAGALVVMNGVPDSPINRYHQVENSVIENNTILDSEHIEFAAGSDEERSAVPKSTRFESNLIANAQPKDSIAVHDDIGGIAFRGNVYDGVRSVPSSKGFKRRKLQFERAANGLEYPVGDANAQVGVARDLVVLSRDETGPSWYPKPAANERFGAGRTIAIEPGQDTLTRAIEESASGDIIALAPGEYTVTEIPVLAHALTIRAENGAETRPRIRFERTTLIELADGGSVELHGLAIDGSSAPDAYGNSVVRTSRYSMLRNYAVRVVDCEIVNLNTNHSFNFLRVAQHTFARSVDILRSSFRAVSGDIVALNREVEDLGIYNGESVVVEDSSFQDVQGAVLNIYRGGTDESTFGPQVSMRGNVLDNVGGGKRNKTDASVFLHGVQTVSIKGNEFRASQPIRVVETVGEPITQIADNRRSDTSPPVVQPWRR